MEQILLFHPFYRWENWGTKEADNVAKVAQLISSRAGTPTVWWHNPGSDNYTTLYESLHTWRVCVGHVSRSGIIGAKWFTGTADLPFTTAGPANSHLSACRPQFLLTPTLDAVRTESYLNTQNQNILLLFINLVTENVSLSWKERNITLLIINYSWSKERSVSWRK